MDERTKPRRNISPWTAIVLFMGALVIYECNLGLRLALGPDQVWLHDLTLACVVAGPIAMAVCPFQNTETQTAWWKYYAVLGFTFPLATGPAVLLFAVYGALGDAALPGPEVAAQGPLAQLVVHMTGPVAALTCATVSLFALGVPAAAWIATINGRRT